MASKEMRALTFDRSLGRADFGDFETGSGKEWLVTNGLGGYAAGTVIGSHTRRYHGLLVAALRPPLGRTLLVAKIDAVARYGTEDYPLFANEFASGAVDPEGYRYLESFHLEGLIPVWIYALADARLERRIWMAHGQNTTYISYTLTRGTSPIELTLTPLCTYRDYHSHTRGGGSLQVEPVPGGFEVKAFEGAQPYRVTADQGRFQLHKDWYWSFKHRMESYRGLDDVEDLLVTGHFLSPLSPRETLTIACLYRDEADLVADSFGSRYWFEEGGYLYDVIDFCPGVERVGSAEGLAGAERDGRMTIQLSDGRVYETNGGA